MKKGPFGKNWQWVLGLELAQQRRKSWRWEVDLEWNEWQVYNRQLEQVTAQLSDILEFCEL